MLELTVYDGDQDVVLQFEHSLLALSKWESRTKKAWSSGSEKTPTQMIDYFQDMLLSPVDPSLVLRLSPKQMDELTNYINEPQTASSVPAEKSSAAMETITSELIYYWMVESNIPFEPANSWHLSRLLMLIQIIAFKRQPTKKRNPQQIMKDWRAQNEKNKQILGIKD